MSNLSKSCLLIDCTVPFYGSTSPGVYSLLTCVCLMCLVSSQALSHPDPLIWSAVNQQFLRLVILCRGRHILLFLSCSGPQERQVSFTAMVLMADIQSSFDFSFYIDWPSFLEVMTDCLSFSRFIIWFCTAVISSTNRSIHFIHTFPQHNRWSKEH